MAGESVLIDTGPLVALLAQDDAEHHRCVEQSRALAKPFLTTWPILTEAAWLLRNQEFAIPKLLVRAARACSVLPGGVFQT
jgi:predicted nucleic acid-binding protein